MLFANIIFIASHVLGMTYVWKDYKYSHQADYTNQLSIVYKN